MTSLSHHHSALEPRAMLLTATFHNRENIWFHRLTSTQVLLNPVSSGSTSPSSGTAVTADEIILKLPF
jgi:hypothetical protein